MLRFVNQASVAEQTDSGKRVVDINHLKTHCSVSVTVTGGVDKRPRVLPVILNGGSVMSTIRERGLQHLLEPDVQVVFPSKSVLTV